MAWDVETSPAPLGPGACEINLHGRSGAVISFRIQQDGVFQSLAGRALWFEISPSLRIALTAGADETEQLITLTDVEVGALPLNQALPFAVRDETSSPIVVLWSGVLRTFGYSGAPV